MTFDLTDLERTLIVRGLTLLAEAGVMGDAADALVALQRRIAPAPWTFADLRAGARFRFVDANGVPGPSTFQKWDVDAYRKVFALGGRERLGSCLTIVRNPIVSVVSEGR